MTAGTPRVETVPPALDGERLDRFVALAVDLSRSAAASLVQDGDVTVNGQVETTRSFRLEEGDEVRVVPPAPTERRLGADPTVAFEVVHEDRDLIVVDKPAGLVVHPGAGRRGGTLAHGLLARYPELTAVGDPERPGIVHRLDRGTSGLLVVARTATAYTDLTAQFAAHTAGREYDALVWGHPRDDAGIVDAALGRSGRDRTRIAVVADGKPARTHYEVVARFDPPRTAQLACRLETGRTHQIRVHLSAIGHAVVGDERYGGRRQSLLLDRPFLHARHLAVTHPTTGERLSWSSPLPAELGDVLGSLRPVARS